MSELTSGVDVHMWTGVGAMASIQSCVNSDLGEC